RRAAGRRGGPGAGQAAPPPSTRRFAGTAGQPQREPDATGAESLATSTDHGRPRHRSWSAGERTTTGPGGPRTGAQWRRLSTPCPHGEAVADPSGRIRGMVQNGAFSGNTAVGRV